MYEFILALHNITRWAVLIFGILVAARAWLGWLGRREWAPGDRRWGTFFSISLDIQFLLGLILYFFLSPITRAALSNFGAAMGSADLRFFAVEHLLFMVVAVVFGHVGTALSRRAENSTAKYRNAAIWFTLALLLILLGIPWGRPLLRGL